MGRGHGAMQQAIDELRTGHTADPDTLRQRALSLVCEVGEARAGLFYQYGRVDGRVVPVHWQFHGGADRLALTMHNWIALGLTWQHADPSAVPASWLGRFRRTLIAIRDPERTYYPTEFYRRLVAPADIFDQLRMLVAYRGVLVAWIGGLRMFGDPGFARRDERRVAALAGAVADALVTAHAVEAASQPEQGCDLLVSPEGDIELASEVGRVIAADEEYRAALGRWVRDLDAGLAAPVVLRGLRLRWSRLSAPGRVRYLVHLQPVAPVALGPALSPTQREIATLARTGLTASEIGAQLAIKESTVRAHLKVIYARLDVCSRVELAIALGEHST